MFTAIEAFLSVIPRWVMLLLIVGATAATAVQTARLTGSKLELSEFRLEKERETTAAQEDLIRAQTVVRQLTEQLGSQLTTVEEKKNAEIRKVSDDRDLAISELRNRSNRPANYDPVSKTARACEDRPGTRILAQDAGLPPGSTPSKETAGNPSAETVGTASGYDLFREDSEFLVQEAARGDFIRSALTACYSSWDAAASKINAKILSEKTAQPLETDQNRNSP